MNLHKLKNTEQLQQFLEGSQAIMFSLPADKVSRYQFIQDILKQFHYRALKKSQKGIVIRFLLQVTHYSRQQLTRLIQQYQSTGTIQQKAPAKPQGFKRRYTEDDVALLVKMDERYETPSGAMIKKLCERAYKVFSQTEYENITNISVSHLYNLRASTAYQKQRRNFDKTKARKVKIGERRKPYPKGKAGYIRIDTVHQGDQAVLKGVYLEKAFDNTGCRPNQRLPNAQDLGKLA